MTASSTTVKSTLGEGKYEELRRFLQYAFPAAPTPDDTTVDGVARALYRKHGPRLEAAGFPEAPASFAAEDAAEARPEFAPSPGYPLYVAVATHHRVRSMTNPNLGSNSNVPFQSEFVGYLPQVRVPLPQSFPTGTNPDIRTRIGNVYLSSDHLVGSIDLIAQKFGSQIGGAPAKVDLITPARTTLTHSRFAAVAVYLGYENTTDPEPSFYILEAGMATGQPMMLYFGATMDTVIVQESGYVPTAYSSATNYYRGTMVVQNDQPVALTVQAFPPESTYYIQVSVAYQSTTSRTNDPFELLVEAAERIALIGQRMGEASGIPLAPLMAELALHLPWVVQPNYGGPGILAGAPSATTPARAPEKALV